MEENKIALSDPATIMFYIMSSLSDLIFLGLLGLLIPGVGLAIAMFVLGAHYFFGIMIMGFFWGKTRGWLPKVFLLLGWILPLPLLTTGLVLAIVSSNKLAAFVIEQVAIQAVAVATAGTGEALEAGAVAAEGAEVAATAAEGMEATSAAAEGAEAAGGAVGEAAEGEAAAGEAEEGLSLTREERNPMENLQEDLTQPQEDELHEGSGAEEPEAEAEGEEPKQGGESEATRKVRDIIERANNAQSDEEENEDDEDSAEAA